MQNDMEWTSYLPLENHLISDGIDTIQNLNYYMHPRMDSQIENEIYDLPRQNEKIDFKKDWISQSIIQQLSSDISNKISLIDLAYQYRISLAMVAKRIQQLQSLQRSDIHKFSIQMDSEQFRILEDNLVSILSGRKDKKGSDSFFGRLS